MQLDIDGSSIVGQSAVRRHIASAVSRRLGPFADRVGTVRIRLCERPPLAATRTLCGVAVTLEPREARDEASAGWVLARAEHDDACEAVEQAIERVAKLAGDELARRDRRWATRARALLVLSPTAPTVERV